VLLLDEPTTGVDPVTRQDFWQLIIRLAAEDGVAVLVSTPYMDEASRCSRVGFLRLGRLLAQGTPAELRARLQGRVLEVRGRPLARARRLAEEDAAVEAAQLFGDRLHVLVREGAAAAVIAGLALRLSAEGGALEQARPIPPHLEDVFISLSGGAP
jgi:ABC-2 type transport system ATP-binding protein